MNGGYDPRDPRNPRNQQARRREEYYRRQREQERRRAREKARRKAIKKQRRRESMRIFGGRMLIFFIVLVIVLLIFLAVFLIFFRSAPDAAEDKGKLDYYYGGERVRSAELTDAVDSGIAYFCFNDLADYLGFYESGSAAEMKFILSNSVEVSDTAEGDGQEEIIIFYTDTWRVTINGQDVTLDVPSRLIGREIWVSLSFITDYMENVSAVYDEKKAEVRVARMKDEESSTEDTVVYLPVSFRLKWAEEIEPIEENPLIGDVVYEAGEGGELEDLGFMADLAEYEQYMNPTGELRDAFLTLVNPTHTLTEDDIPTDLMDVKHTSSARSTQQLREYACKALDALYLEMHAAGYYDMAVYSGFRTYTYQATLFETYTSNEMAANPSLTREEAEAIVLTYSTRPGTSEHQTGLAVDMDTLGTFTTDFEYEEEYAWLGENAWKFGFILRFPKDKTEITTIQFEPWHYRYVGRYHARKIHESGLCLEEYLAQLEG